MSKHFGQDPLETPKRARAIASGRKAKNGRFLTGQAQSRRQLLAGVLRYATLGLLGVAGGSVVAKRQRLVRAPLEIPERERHIPATRKGESGRFLTGREDKCINRGNQSRMRRLPMSAKTRRFSLGICRGCAVFEKCALPQALSVKQVLARMGDGGK